MVASALSEEEQGVSPRPTSSKTPAATKSLLSKTAKAAYDEANADTAEAVHQAALSQPRSVCFTLAYLL